jgi:hypothetical protein
MGLQGLSLLCFFIISAFSEASASPINPGNPIYTTRR